MKRPQAGSEAQSRGPVSPLAGPVVQTVSFPGLRIQEQPVLEKDWATVPSGGKMFGFQG